VREFRWFLSALLLLFVGLKLAGAIEWSWWWVTAPFWVPLAISLLCYAVAGIAWVFTPEEERNRIRIVNSLESLQRRLRRQ